MTCLCHFVNLAALRQDLRIQSLMALAGGDKLNRAVEVLFVVPVHKVSDPEASLVKVCKWLLREAGAVFKRLEQRFRIGVVITYARSAKGCNDAEFLQGCQQGCAFHRRTVVGMQSQLFRADAFAQVGFLKDLACVFAGFASIDFPAHNASTGSAQVLRLYTSIMR